MSQVKNLVFLGYSKYDIYDNGRVYSYRSCKFLDGWVCKYTGYHIVTLHNDDNEPKQLKVHRLVGLAFVDGFREGLIINHKEKPKTHNHYTNLEWTTYKGNLEYAYEKGEHRGKGYKGKIIPFEVKNQTNKSGRLSEIDVREVCRLLEEGYRCSDISRLTGIPVRNLNNIRTGTNYKSISEEYNIPSGVEKRADTDLVIEICERLQKGQGVLSIARDLGVDRKTVGNIRNRNTFTSISTNYKFDSARCATTIPKGSTLK